MPDKFRDTVNLPIAIPAWGIVTLIISAVFTAGVTFQKLDQVIERSKKIDQIQERQIANIAAIANMQQQVANHESRISAIERAKWEGGHK